MPCNLAWKLALSIAVWRPRNRYLKATALNRGVGREVLTNAGRLTMLAVSGAVCCRRCEITSHRSCSALLRSAGQWQTRCPSFRSAILIARSLSPVGMATAARLPGNEPVMETANPVGAGTTPRFRPLCEI